MAFMEQKAPQQLNIKNERDAILESLRLNEDEMLTNASISVVNTGNSFVIVPVKGAEIIKHIQPDFDLIFEISEANGSNWILCFLLARPVWQQEMPPQECSRQGMV